MAELSQQLAATVLSIGIVDVLDIVLVAYIVYRGLLLLEGTRGSSVIRGVLIVLVLLGVTSWLPTLNWMLGQLLLPGVIALVVIFQPELRLALERLGRAGSLSGAFMRLEVEEQQRVINEIVEAAEELSERRMGALIVLQRESGLMDVTRTGKTINGRVLPLALCPSLLPIA